jgi:hypothetical protein
MSDLDDAATAYAAGPGSNTKQPAGELWIITTSGSTEGAIKIPVPDDVVRPGWINGEICDAALAKAGWRRTDSQWDQAVYNDPELWGANVRPLAQ